MLNKAIALYVEKSDKNAIVLYVEKHDEKAIVQYVEKSHGIVCRNRDKNGIVQYSLLKK